MLTVATVHSILTFIDDHYARGTVDSRTSLIFMLQLLSSWT